MDPIYSRQTELKLSIPNIATVVGCGGTGHWTALFLAMSGVKELVLIDPDRIEVSNLNRLMFPPLARGRHKVKELEKIIKNIRPKIRVETHIAKIECPSHCIILRGTIFCCTDNLKSQQIICAYARKNELPYQRIGYDGTILNVSKAFPLSFEENPREGYRIVPSWVVPAALAAAAGVYSQLYGSISLMDDISKLTIADSSFIPDGLKKEIREASYREGYDDGYDEGRSNPPDDYGYCPDCNRRDCDFCDVREESYEEGYDDGFNKGKDKGYAKGFKEGKKVGYSEALAVK
jgi:hypothetical protein